MIEPDADIHEVRAENGIGGRGGRSWIRLERRRREIVVVEHRGTPGQLSAAVCIDGETAYVPASDGPLTNRGGVYRARLGSALSPL